MISMVKAVAGLSSVAGASLAVSVPLALNSFGSSKVEDKEVKAVDNSGGGVDLFTLSKCEKAVNSEYESIDFGAAQKVGVCGDSLSINEGLTKVDDWTSLMKEGWNDEDNLNHESENKNKGTKECLDDQKSAKWSIMVNSGNSTKYLGLCGTSELDQTAFAKKMKKDLISVNNEKESLGICENNCGSRDNSALGGSAEVLEREQSNNGKEVKFYRKK